MSTAPSSPLDPQSSPLPAVWLDLVVAAATGEEVDGEASTRRAEELLGREPTDVEWAALHAARGHVRALRHLGRCEVPKALEGCVVASLEAGHRQERATVLLAAMERMEAPAALDALVRTAIDRAASEHPAPAILDRLVAERIAEEEAEAGFMTTATRGAGGGPFSRRMAARLLVSAGLALAVIVTLRLTDDSDAKAPEPRITFVRVDTVHAAGLSPTDRMFLSSLTGQAFGDR